MDNNEPTKGAIVPHRVYDINDAAELLKVNRKTIYQLQETEQLPKKIVGRGYKFLGEDLLRFMGSQTVDLTKK